MDRRRQSRAIPPPPPLKALLAQYVHAGLPEGSEEPEQAESCATEVAGGRVSGGGRRRPRLHPRRATGDGRRAAAAAPATVGGGAGVDGEPGDGKKGA